MFVPSLSWQNDRFFTCKNDAKRASFRTGNLSVRLRVDVEEDGAQPPTIEAIERGVGCAHVKRDDITWVGIDDVVWYFFFFLLRCRRRCRRLLLPHLSQRRVQWIAMRAWDDS
jgi:hypothetical protein